MIEKRLKSLELNGFFSAHYKLLKSQGLAKDGMGRDPVIPILSRDKHSSLKKV